MPKKAVLTEEEVEDSKAMSSMMTKAKQSSKELKSEVSKNLDAIKNKKKLRPIIKKLKADEKISDEKYKKLIGYLIDDEFDKIIKTIKKFPEYLEDEESSSDEEEVKKSSKKKGKGIESEIMDYLKQF